MFIIYQVNNIGIVKAQEIKWSQATDWSEIKNEATKSGKYIFIDCYATWCVPCKKMDKEVYTNDSVVELFNGQFIAIKLQMDRTGKDNERVKSMYNLVKEIGNNYKVEGYPTLLFFSPEGILLKKELGFKESLELVKVASEAILPEAQSFYKQLERYKAGQKDYATLKDLAVFVVNILNNRTLAKQIANDYVNHSDHKALVNISSIYFVRDVAKDYKKSVDLAIEFKEYLLSIGTESLATDSTLRFISNYLRIVRTNDRIFDFLKNDSVNIDSIMRYKGWTRALIGRIITNEELYSKLVQDSKPVLLVEPEWNEFKAVIASKYPFINANKLVLDFQIDYYRFVKLDWKKWAKYKDIRIREYPPDKSDWIAISNELNEGGAWDAFLQCNDKDVLRKTLEWIDLAIKLSKEANPRGYQMFYLDTKANVLYKIGRVSEAMKIEKEAIIQTRLWAKEVSDTRPAEALKDFTETIQKMKERKPTYIEQGAKWESAPIKNKKSSLK